MQVSFRVSLDLLDYIDTLTNGDESEQPEHVTLEVTPYERKLNFRSQLVVEFNNLTTQTVPLSATLVVPAFCVSKSLLDFGTCLVGQRRELQFIISNTTSSASYWVTSVGETPPRRGHTRHDDNVPMVFGAIANTMGSHNVVTNIVAEQKSSTCQDSTFALTPSSGMLAAHVSHSTNNKTVISCYFTAK